MDDLIVILLMWLALQQQKKKERDKHMCKELMNQITFDNLLCKVGPLLIHANTHKFPISAKQRLAITLWQQVIVNKL